jgi:hypothetical protein
MAKKNDKNLDRDQKSLNKLSQIMLDQNESLRKLLEELSIMEKDKKRKGSRK